MIRPTMSDETSPPEPVDKRAAAPKWSEKIQAALATILLIVTTATNLVDKLKPYRDLVPASLRWPLVGVVAIFAGWLVLRAWLGSRAAGLVSPEVRDLRDRREELKGRNEDLHRLIAACRESRLIQLVGESGVGKSTLIRAGLCDALRDDPELFIVYLESLGTDWERGPREALSHAVWSALTGEQRAALGLGATRPSDLPALIRAIKAKLSRTLLVVFDQLDDYHAQHRAHFVRKGRIRTAKEMQKESTFWGDVAALLLSDDLRCIFVARSDATAVFESLRFVEPHLLSPILGLRKDHAKEATDNQVALKGGDGGEEPGGAWDLLKERIIRDLVEAGGDAVLPAQLQIALKGLVRLPRLTLHAYERAGGLLGLERHYVEDEIAFAGSSAKLSLHIALAILSQMVDDSSSQRSKAVPRTVEEIQIRLKEQGHGDVPKEAITKLLEGLQRAPHEGHSLERTGIVRKVSDKDSDAKWTLYHDYVARPLREARRYSQRHQMRLQEGAASFRLAAGWRARWSALLSPWEQIVLLWVRFFRRKEGVRYGVSRRFAAWSTLRFAPYALVFGIAVTAGVVFWQARAEQERNRAVQSFVDRFSLPISDSRSLTALWEFARAGEAVQFGYFNRLLESEESAERLPAGLYIIEHAVVGTDLGKRRRLEERLFARCQQAPPSARFVRRDCLWLLDFLEPRRPEVLRFLITAGLKAPFGKDSYRGDVLIHLSALRTVRALDIVEQNEIQSAGGDAIRELNMDLPLSTTYQIVATLVHLPVKESDLQLAAVVVENWAEKAQRSERFDVLLMECLLAHSLRSQDLDDLMIATLRRSGAPWVDGSDDYDEADKRYHLLGACRFDDEAGRALLLRLSRSICASKNEMEREQAARGIRRVLDFLTEKNDPKLDETRQLLSRCAPWEPESMEEFATNTRARAKAARGMFDREKDDASLRYFDALAEVDIAAEEASRWLADPDASRGAKKAATLLAGALRARPEIALPILRYKSTFREKLKDLDKNDPDQRWLDFMLRAAAAEVSQTEQDLVDLVGAGGVLPDGVFDKEHRSQVARPPTAQQLDTAMSTLQNQSKSKNKNVVESFAFILRAATASDRASAAVRLVNLAATPTATAELAFRVASSLSKSWPPSEKLPSVPSAYPVFLHYLAYQRTAGLSGQGPATQALLQMVPEERRRDAANAVLRELSGRMDISSAEYAYTALPLLSDVVTNDDLVKLLGHVRCLGPCRTNLLTTLQAKLGHRAPGADAGFWSLIEFAAAAGVKVDLLPEPPASSASPVDRHEDDSL